MISIGQCFTIMNILEFYHSPFLWHDWSGDDVCTTVHQVLLVDPLLCETVEALFAPMICVGVSSSVPRI